MMISAGRASEVLIVGVGGVPGGCGEGSGIRSLRRAGGGAPFPFGVQRVSWFFAVPFWQARQPDCWFWRSIARSLSIAAFTFLCPGNSTPCFFPSRSSARGLLLRYYVSSIAAREKPSMAILAIFNARHMSDCSSCTQPPCLAIVADMLKTYQTLVDAFINEIRLLPLQYTLL